MRRTNMFSFFFSERTSLEDKKQDVLVERTTEWKLRDFCFGPPSPQSALTCSAMQITETLWAWTFHYCKMIKFKILCFLLDLMHHNFKLLFCF